MLYLKEARELLLLFERFPKLNEVRILNGQHEDKEGALLHFTSMIGKRLHSSVVQARLYCRLGGFCRALSVFGANNIAVKTNCKHKDKFYYI